MDGPLVPGAGLVSVATLSLEQVRAAVESVVDPEIPVLSIGDLGILRSVEFDDGRVAVTITPTYSGCPAMRQIEDDVILALESIGVDDAVVHLTHTPPWTSDWMTEEARTKLARFGIAPPTFEGEVLCPRCESDSPRMVARFGSTACKALMVCTSCGEPFDWFKRF